MLTEPSRVDVELLNAETTPSSERDLQEQRTQKRVNFGSSDRQLVGGKRWCVGGRGDRAASRSYRRRSVPARLAGALINGRESERHGLLAAANDEERLWGIGARVSRMTLSRRQ